MSVHGWEPLCRSRPFLASMGAHGHSHGGTEGHSDDTLPIRIGSVFIVWGVSLLGCAAAFMIDRVQSDKDPLLVHRLLKSLAAGVILGVGFVHVLGEAAAQLAELSDYPFAYVIAIIGIFVIVGLKLVSPRTTRPRLIG
jgi:hypothetical protein